MDIKLIKSDYDKLEKMMSYTRQVRVINKHGQAEMFIYYMPRDKKYTDKALAIFKKHNIPAQAHMSSLNNRLFPGIRMPVTPQANEISINLNKIRDARTKRDALTRGRTNVLQNILNKVQRVFGGEHQK